MRSLGIKSDRRLLRGSPDFFNVTKKIHNALQSGKINLTELKKEVYAETRRLAEQELDLYSAFEPSFALNHRRAPALTGVNGKEIPDER